MRSLMIPLVLALCFGVACSNKDKKAAPAKATKSTKSAKKATSTQKATSKAKTSDEAGMSVSCKLDTYTRDLYVVKPAEGGCEVIYTKDGETKTIANGNNVSGYCGEVFNRVKGKLESSGFKCE